MNGCGVSRFVVFRSKKNILHLYLGVFLCFSRCPLIGTGDFSDNLNSPRQIVALANDDVMLPCHLGPEMSVDAETMTIEWSRPDMMKPVIVHLHRDGREVFKYKNPYFKGRTALFLEEVEKGNVSLKLSRVKLSDEGIYRCHVPKSKTSESELKLFFHLIVGAVSQPKISIVETKDEGVVLQCESGGWYPEPEVEWLDSEGHILSAGPTETLKDPDGTYTVRRNVTVEKTATNRFICRVQHQNISQTREVESPVVGAASELLKDCGPRKDQFILFIIVCGMIGAFVVVVVAVVFLHCGLINQKQNRVINVVRNVLAQYIIPQEPDGDPSTKHQQTAQMGLDTSSCSPKPRSVHGLNDSGYGSPGYKSPGPASPSD